MTQQEPRLAPTDDRYWTAFQDGEASERNDVLILLEAIGHEDLAERIANQEHKP